MAFFCCGCVKYSYDVNSRESLKQEFANGQYLRGDLLVNDIVPRTIVNATVNPIAEVLLKKNTKRKRNKF